VSRSSGEAFFGPPAAAVPMMNGPSFYIQDPCSDERKYCFCRSREALANRVRIARLYFRDPGWSGAGDYPAPINGFCCDESLRVPKRGSGVGRCVMVLWEDWSTHYTI